MLGGDDLGSWKEKGGRQKKKGEGSWKVGGEEEEGVVVVGGGGEEESYVKGERGKRKEKSEGGMGRGLCVL